MLSARNLLPALLLLALAGCGFRPLYGGAGAAGPRVSGRLAQIDIGLIANREGQLVRQALERQLRRNGAPVFYRYHLAVSYGYTGQAIGIQQDTSNTRNRFIAHAQWTLTPEGAPGRVITRGTVQTMDAYNVIDNQNFAGTLDQGTLRHRLADAVARRITEQLAIYFRNHPGRG